MRAEITQQRGEQTLLYCLDLRISVKTIIHHQLLLSPLNRYDSTGITLNSHHPISSQKSSGKEMFSTVAASANSGAISSAEKPAMPQPMRVTRNCLSGCCVA